MRIISWFAIVYFLLEITYSVFVVPGYGRTALSTRSCVSFRAMKNGRRKADPLPAAAIYARAKQDSSAARWPDILRRSYRLSTQSPASSQCARRMSLHALDYLTTICAICQGFFSKNFRNFSSIFKGFSLFSQSFFCIFCSRTPNGFFARTVRLAVRFCLFLVWFCENSKCQNPLSDKAFSTLC